MQLMHKSVDEAQLARVKEKPRRDDPTGADKGIAQLEHISNQF